MKYFIEFSAYVDERKRPENFPHVIHIGETYDVPSEEALKEVVNGRFVALVTSAGLIAMRDEDKPIETKLTFNQRRFVPWHMITHMEVEVNMIQPEPPKVPQDLIVPQIVLDPNSSNEEPAPTVH